ncbi:MAG: hypothetical protein IT555_13420 [Acetobacteraceae bacterium]|nr:hypothetical protein [Acetobacteraceae bacterium]
MKNITVSVDDETYRRARIKAAERDTSVSALVREFLNTIAVEETERERFDRLRRLEIEARARVPAGFAAADRLPRDALYDREP